MYFVILNDVRQALPLPNGKFSPRFIHHATIRRGFKEYIIFRDKQTNEVYLEEVERHKATFTLNEIKDEQEWQDLKDFAEAAGFLQVVAKEMKVKT